MKNKISKLKKYLFLISIIFFLVSFSHIIYNYLYSGAKQIAIKGGVISEGLVGNFPSLNPFKPLSGNNEYLINLLYRSLLKYDLKEQKLVGDITSCDISNLSYIECYLNNDVKWSNGEKITIDDIEATYKILQNTDINPVIKSLLKESEIITEENIIAFKNKKNDINFLNIFFQPIVNKELIDKLGEEKLNGNFPSIDGIYSGKFKITNISGDLALGNTKFILERNEFYKQNPVLIDQLIIKLFSSVSNLLKNKDNINIFNDNENLIGDSVPRFNNTKYILPQYVSLFINKENVSNINLRTFLLDQINPENLINILGEQNYKVVNNPFFTDKILDNESKNKNFENILSKLGYYKKSKLLEKFGKNEKIYSDEIKIEVDNVDKLTIDNFQVDSEYIISPEYVDKYNFITKDDILLKGVVPENTQNVYINDYKLTSFNSGDRYFYYRLKSNYESIVEGINNYKIYFEKNGEKIFAEEFNFVYETSYNKLEETKKELLTKLETQRLIEEKDKILAEQNDNISIEKNQEVENMIKQINTLDEQYYYNDDLEIFTLELAFIDGDEKLYNTSNYIQKTLSEIGIKVNNTPISLNSIQNFIEEEKSYDMILTGINLGYFYYNLFPYLHSSQAKGGYNFSKIRKTSLDILLEELKSNILNKTRINEIEEKIIQILKDEQILKTLYTPKISLLIDKNIKDILLIENLVKKENRTYIYDNAHIKEKKIINKDNKNFTGLLKYIISKIYE